jgi:tRNA (cmo5U34)-methyltransferase
MSEEGREAVEEMAAFFDARAAGYDAYMREEIFPGEMFDGFYRALSAPIGETDEPLRILDLGCGTGLELEPLLQRAPNAAITGLDLARGMLEELRARYRAQMGQIALIGDSFLTASLGSQVYDYVLSGLAMHHFLLDAKRELYKRIHAALRPGGKYVEGDSVVPREMEGEFLAEYAADAATVPRAPDGTYHLDVPFALETQRSLLLEAGFRDFELIWQKDPSMVWNIAVYAVTA